MYIKKSNKIAFDALTRNKPCSVENNHLSTHNVSDAFFGLEIVSSPTYFGFLACGVYPFHPAYF